jgi:ribose 5-phosphate isomerase A
VTADRTIPLNARRALEMIRDGDAVGLGSGRAASAFVEALAERVRAGLRIRGVPTSEATARLASQHGIPLTTLDEVLPLDITVDGADEVDPQRNLIKGLGGALVRERIVATASRRLVILVGPEKISEKVVPALGSRGILPVEVVPFGMALCRRRLADLGFPADVRREGGRPFVTDNGNVILDCQIKPLADPAAVEQAIHAIPGVVGTGLFLGIADTVLIDRGDALEVRQRPES